MGFDEEFPELAGLLEPAQQTMIMTNCISKTKVRDVVSNYIAPINQQQIFQELGM